MKILLIHQYFKTPADAGGIRSYHVARGLVERGHEVVVITAHNRSSYRKTTVEGSQVHYLPVAYDNTFGFLRRVVSFLRFTFRSIRIAVKEPDVDIAYVITTPLSTAFVALYLKTFRGIPYVFEVGDLWPEVPVKMGILQNPLIKALAYLLEKKAYHHAIGLVALSPGIAEYMTAKVPDQRVVIVPNMSDLDFFQPSTTAFPDRIKVLYCGAIGVANHLEFLLDAAKECQREKLPVSFTIVGEGARKIAIATLARSVANVEVLEAVDRSGLKSLIDQHDAFYVSFQDVAVLHTGSPNKYFDGLAAGKLMILNLGGWLKELTESSQCGFAYDPHRPSEFVKQLTTYLKNPDLLTLAQQSARKLAKDFSVERSIEKIEKFILDCTGKNETE